MLVSNTSTLILLAKVGCLEEFISIASGIVIPSEVREEVSAKKSFDAKLIASLIEKKKVKVDKANQDKTRKAMTEFRLDYGEAAAYSLFDQKKHKAILTDDGELIKLCRIEGIPFICAMAVVIRLYEKKRLSKKSALEKLDALCEKGRYAREIYMHFRGEII